MFKKKAFLISLALLASNFLLPNEVKSGLEIGEEIIYETEVYNNMRLSKYPNGYILELNNYGPYCSGGTLTELLTDCTDKFTRFNNTHDPLLYEMAELVKPLIEGEQDMELGEMIKSEMEMDFSFKISRSTDELIGKLNFWKPIDIFYCKGQTFYELMLDCSDELTNDDRYFLHRHIDSAINELIDPLIEEEEDIEDAQDIEEDVVVVEEVEEVETTEAEDIDVDSITVESLPYSVDCTPKNKDLKIEQNKKEKFVVRFAKGKKFYKELDFDEAVDVFEETYEDKCVE